ncbi:hypothetical protein GCM10011572_24720 [Pseudoduganella buxea]|uniref:Secreted protein n=1 Tax=Pseudoduganella buxea TaxID=1949069 RepID=A0ABQ1KNG0_9BURK|nr:hypothetical protein GCM10011572_24720 [Pseudoduganella buxea]
MSGKRCGRGLLVALAGEAGVAWLTMSAASPEVTTVFQVGMQPARSGRRKEEGRERPGPEAYFHCASTQSNRVARFPGTVHEFIGGCADIRQKGRPGQTGYSGDARQARRPV